MSDMRDTILSYPKIAQRLESRPADRSKVLRNLEEIRADYSKTYVKSFEKFLDATLPQLYDGINFNQNGVDFSQMVKERCVVLVPNHQSHADYVAINYMTFKNFGIPLYVAGGNNLNIFPIGKLFRKSGCFFIRRSFQNDILYRLTLEGYLFYLLKNQKPIEFFFEGGRSRTGKLLPPRFGLYHMLLEAHQSLVEESSKKGEKAPELTFVPVSINHEYVPEQQSLVKESRGGKKTKESTMQLFNLLGLFSHQFGNVHITLGNPITMSQGKNDQGDMKKVTQDLAFKCFLEVGRNMVITPSSLLAFIMLDGPDGALKWSEIRSNAISILNYCRDFGAPITNSLRPENRDSSLQRALDIFIGNKKVQIIGKPGKGPVFYSISSQARSEMLYFKNSILHHFLVPWGITAAWISLFSGEVQSVRDLQKFFVDRRSMLKHEFYLPSTKDFLNKTLHIISHIIGREVKSLQDCLDLSHKDLYKIASHLSVFARSMNFIIEAYFISALTMKSLFDEDSEGFKTEVYLKKFGQTFESEKNLGRVIKYPESFSLSLARSSLKYFEHSGHIINEDGVYKKSQTRLIGDACDYLETALQKTLSLHLTPSIDTLEADGT